jgi:hypothetical protein
VKPRFSGAQPASERVYTPPKLPTATPEAVGAERDPGEAHRRRVGRDVVPLRAVVLDDDAAGEAADRGVAPVLRVHGEQRGADAGGIRA